MQKSDPTLGPNIAYIFEILHCNHFIIHSIWDNYNDEVVAVEDFIDVGNILAVLGRSLWAHHIFQSFC